MSAVAEELFPWKKKTRQEEGADTEKRIAKEKGARLHPRSGAGRIKDDASDDDAIYEIKDARKTHTLKASELKSLYSRAMRQGKRAVYLVYFSDQGFTAHIELVPGGKEVVE